MDSCLIQIKLPEGKVENIDQWEEEILDWWYSDLHDGHSQSNLIVKRGDVESIVDKLNSEYNQHDEFRLTMHNLELSLPVTEEELEEAEKREQEKSNENKAFGRTVSRQELLSSLTSSTRLNIMFIMMLLLSVVVAIVGLINDNIAVVIAAMVIAPLLGPNITLALATTLVDYKLGWRAIKVGASAALIAFIIAIVLGVILPESYLSSNEILARTKVGYGDFILALAAGTAGTLAFTTAGSSTLIGVMVAVALLPPLLVFGLMLGLGSYMQALGAGMLFTINFIAVNLAAVSIFYIQGIRPEGWWEQNKARRTSSIAIMLWAVVLILLVVFLYFIQKNHFNLQVYTPVTGL